ncbi:MAG: dnrK [Verrucomicrobiales bacterium]|nr:dnrK [Verrucomicrobiales bacterium]
MSQRLDLVTPPQADPLSIYRYRDGLYAVDLLCCALVEFNFFTWLKNHPSTFEEICRHFGFHARPTDVMLSLFKANALVEQNHEILSLTVKGAEFLVEGAHFSLIPYYASLKDRPVVKDYAKVLTTDKAANWGSFKNEIDWTKAMEDPGFAAKFTAAMDCRGIFLAQALCRQLKGNQFNNVLDIGGGSGIYSCSLAAHFPHLTATVYEKSPVDKIASRLIEERGYSEKVSTFAGNMFEDVLPQGFDAHLYSNVLHDWPVGMVESLLRKSYSALPPGGALLIHDAHLNRNKNGPLPVCEYSALLMHSTEGKCYGLGEMEQMLSAAGFGEFQFKETAVDRSLLQARKQ